MKRGLRLMFLIDSSQNTMVLQKLKTTNVKPTVKPTLFKDWKRLKLIWMSSPADISKLKIDKEEKSLS